MHNQELRIHHIPALLWGNTSERAIIAVHGNMSHKTDIPIEILAQVATTQGYQVLSFDLPEHGARQSEGIPCEVQQCIHELSLIMKYAQTSWQNISVFANSMGAYFSLLAYQNAPLERALFLSPVVDMQKIIENMMQWFSITEERLESEQSIATPIGQTLYWDYYCFVRENPISLWNIPTFILSGAKDTVCESEILAQFCENFSCANEVIAEAEHYFHSKAELNAFRAWLEKTL